MAFETLLTVEAADGKDHLKDIEEDDVEEDDDSDQ
jgi:hypothetical protein